MVQFDSLFEWLDVPLGSVKFSVSYITIHISVYSIVSVYNMKLYHSYEQRQVVTTYVIRFSEKGVYFFAVYELG